MNGNFSDNIHPDIAFHKNFSVSLYVKQKHIEMNYDDYDDYNDDDDYDPPPPKAA